MYRFGNILLVSTQRRNDVILLLFSDESRLFFRGICYHQPPKNTPNQAKRAFNVEDGLPTEIRGYQAG